MLTTLKGKISIFSASTDSRTKLRIYIKKWSADHLKTVFFLIRNIIRYTTRYTNAVAQNKSPLESALPHKNPAEVSSTGMVRSATSADPVAKRTADTIIRKGIRKNRNRYFVKKVFISVNLSILC